MLKRDDLNGSGRTRRLERRRRTASGSRNKAGQVLDAERCVGHDDGSAHGWRTLEPVDENEFNEIIKAKELRSIYFMLHERFFTLVVVNSLFCYKRTYKILLLFYLIRRQN